MMYQDYPNLHTDSYINKQYYYIKICYFFFPNKIHLLILFSSFHSLQYHPKGATVFTLKKNKTNRIKKEGKEILHAHDACCKQVNRSQQQVLSTDPKPFDTLTPALNKLSNKVQLRREKRSLQYQSLELRGQLIYLQSNPMGNLAACLKDRSSRFLASKLFKFSLIKA